MKDFDEICKYNKNIKIYAYEPSNNTGGLLDFNQDMINKLIDLG